MCVVTEKGSHQDNPCCSSGLFCQRRSERRERIIAVFVGSCTSVCSVPSRTVSTQKISSHPQGRGRSFFLLKKKKDLVVNKIPRELVLSENFKNVEAAARVDWQFRTQDLMPRAAEDERALLRSQSGLGAGMSFSVVPSNPLVRIESQLFRVLLLRRLRLTTSHTCRCGRLLDFIGHHRASCAQAGVLGRRGFAVESAAARVPRGWRKGCHQLDGARPGPLSIGSGGGRAPVVRWSSVGSRHDPCVCLPLRRDHQTRGSKPRRSSEARRRQVV